MMTKQFHSRLGASRYAQHLTQTEGRPYFLERAHDGWAVVSDDTLEVMPDFPLEDDAYDSATELMDALVMKDRNLAARLVELPLDASFIDGRGVSLLMVSAYRGYAEICEKLLSLGADVLHGYTDVDCGDEEAVDEDSVLLRAKSSNDWSTIKLIEEAYVRASWNFLKGIAQEDPSWFQYAGAARLADAARLGMTSLCVEMVTAGISVKGAGGLAISPLHEAAEHDEMTTCFVLLALGGDITGLRHKDGYSEQLLESFEVVRDFFERQHRN